MVVMSEVRFVVDVLLVFSVSEFYKLLKAILAKLSQDIDIKLFVFGKIFTEYVEVRGELRFVLEGSLLMRLGG